MRGRISDAFFLRVKELRELADLIEIEAKKIKAEEDLKAFNKLKETLDGEKGTS